MKTSMSLTGLMMLLLVFSGAGVTAEKTKPPRVGSVSFEGNRAYDDARLEGLILTRPSRFLAPSTYHRDVFMDDLETLVAFYRQNGFLQALIVDTAVVVDSVENRVDISIELAEGARTMVEGVALFGNTFVADTALMEYVAIKKGDPLRRAAIEDAVVRILSLYAEHGFLSASVTPKVEVNDSAHLALVDFVVREGPSSRIGDITLSGVKRTQEHVIRRELDFSRGDTIRYSQLIRSQRRLYLTGLFESVFVRPAQSADTGAGERTILVEIREKPSSELAFSVGYGTIEKARGRAELNTINLAGTARKAGVALEANFIKQGASLSFSEPWTLGTRWKTDLSLFGRLRQEPAYHAEEIGGKLTLGRSLGAFTRVALAYRLENTSLSHIDVSTSVEDSKPRLRSLTLTLSYDSRDNLFDASSGSYMNWSNEVAGGPLKGSNTFAKSTVVLKRFHALGRSTVIGSALELGWMGAFGESDDVPISERFYTGGPTSLRGFSYQMVGPVDANGEPLGGRFKVVCNLLEIRRSIYKTMGGVLFCELGNVWKEPAAVRIGDLRTDVGAGLRINSPLGILRLDYGINLDRRRDEPSGRLFFSMGQAF